MGISSNFLPLKAALTCLFVIAIVGDILSNNWTEWSNYTTLCYEEPLAA